VNWDAAYETARALNAERMLLLALGLANEVLGTRLPQSVVDQIQADHTAIALVGEVSARLLSDGKLQWNAFRRVRYRARLVPGSTDGLRYVWRLATQPAEDEWTAAHGSVWSAGFQAMLRPLRLVRKHAAAEPPSERDAT